MGAALVNHGLDVWQQLRRILNFINDNRRLICRQKRMGIAPRTIAYGQLVKRYETADSTSDKANLLIRFMRKLEHIPRRYAMAKVTNLRWQLKIVSIRPSYRGSHCLNEISFSPNLECGTVPPKIRGQIPRSRLYQSDKWLVNIGI